MYNPCYLVAVAWIALVLACQVHRRQQRMRQPEPELVPPLGPLEPELGPGLGPAGPVVGRSWPGPKQGVLDEVRVA